MLQRKSLIVVILGFLVGAMHPSQVIGQQSMGIAGIAEAAMPSIVVIRGETDQGEASGSGFLISDDGTIITCLHVIDEMRSGAVQLSDGDIYNSFTIRAYDERRDIAIIQIAGFDLPFIELGNSNDVRVGESVVIIGNPLGLEKTVTTGVVSAIRSYEGIGKVIQTDAAANPGNSGGPVLNMDGQVVGIVDFKLRGSENLNFAIPINYARGLLATMEEDLSLEDMEKILSRPGEVFGSAARSSNRRVLPGNSVESLGEVRAIYVDSLGDDLIREKLIGHLAKSDAVVIVNSPSHADVVVTGIATMHNMGRGWDASLAVRVVNAQDQILWTGDAKPGFMARSASSSVAKKIAKDLLKAIKKDRKRRGR